MLMELHNEMSDRVRVENKSHAIDGQKTKSGDYYGRNTPNGAGYRHVSRSHAEIEATHMGDPSLADGVSMRVGMGSMDEAIDDGVGY